MKTLQYVEKRIYILEVTFDHNIHNAFFVHEALKKAHPEYKDTEYEYTYINRNTGLIKVFRESTYDFVEA